MSRGLVGVMAVPLLVVALLSAAACGGQTGPAMPTCPDDVPAGCQLPDPGFTAAAAIASTHCAKCHIPGGLASKFPFQTYDQIAFFAGDINLQLQTCAMPPWPEPVLTSQERQTLFDWILCGSLND